MKLSVNQLKNKILRSIPAIFLLSGILFSCGEHDPSGDNLITVAGSIDGLNGGTIRVFGDEEISGAEIGADGTFLLPFYYDEDYYFTFMVPGNSFTLYLSPGDSIFITTGNDDFAGNFRASGDKAGEARYLVRKRTLIMESGLTNLGLLASEAPADFISKKAITFGLARELVNELKGIEGIDHKFIEMENSDIDYHNAYLDFIYPIYHRRIRGLPEDAGIDFPGEYSGERIDATDLDNPFIIKSQMGRQLLDFHINTAVSEIIGKDTAAASMENSWITLTMNVADSLISNPRVRDHVKYNALKGNMEYRGPSRYAELYTKFLIENTTPGYEERINRIVERWEPISPGKEVPDFAFTDIEGEEVRLSDLSGKLIYIDVWATWCGPCLAEHPYWNALMEEYNENEVAFLTISIDNSRDPWIKMVKDKNMEGFTWFAEDAWQSEIAQHFMINGIPRFLLLDGERKVIDPSAERPSGKIRETLDKYL